MGINRVSLRRGMDDDLLIILEGDAEDLPEMEIDFPASVVHLSPAGKLVMAGNDHLMMKIKDRSFKGLSRIILPGEYSRSGKDGRSCTVLASSE